MVEVLVNEKGVLRPDEEALALDEKQDVGIFRVKVGEQARLVIPAQIREAMDIAPGAIVTMRIEDGRLIVESKESARRRLRGALRGAGDLVGQLLDERREEARRESEKALDSTAT